MITTHDLILVAITLLLSNLLTRLKKAESNKPETISELNTHIDAVGDSLNKRFDTLAAGVTDEIDSTNKRLNELAESTTKAFEAFKG